MAGLTQTRLTSTFLTLVVWISILQGVFGDEKRIYEDVIGARHYTPKVRPRRNSSQPVKVNLEFELRQISNLDQQNQILYTSGYIVATWEDDYLKWSVDKYGGIDTIIVPPGEVWLPDIGIINSANTFYQDSFTQDFRVHVRNDGHVLWSFGGNFQTSCELDLTNFPFDRQLCLIIIENWAYNSYQVELINSTTNVHLDDFHPNGEWDIEHSGVKVEEIYHDIFPGKPFPKVIFELYLQRKAGYYGLNIIAPCFFIIVLALVMFWLPADSGEKVSLGVTVLLALSVFQLVIADNSPRTSDFVPILSLYVSFVMGMTAVSTFVTIVSLYFHHHLPNKPVPQTTKLVFFKFLATALCMKDDVPNMSSTILVQPKNSDDEENHIPSTRSNGSLKSGETVETTMYSDSKGKASQTPNAQEDHLVHGQNSEMSPFNQDLSYMASRMREEDKDDAVRGEWKALARVLDRLFFFICLIIIVAVCIWMFTQSDSPKHLH